MTSAIQVIENGMRREYRVTGEMAEYIEDFINSAIEKRLIGVFEVEPGEH